MNSTQLKKNIEAIPGIICRLNNLQNFNQGNNTLPTRRFLEYISYQHLGFGNDLEDDEVFNPDWVDTEELEEALEQYITDNPQDFPFTKEFEGTMYNALYIIRVISVPNKPLGIFGDIFGEIFN